MKLSPPAGLVPSRSSWPTEFPSEAFAPSSSSFFSGSSLPPASAGIDDAEVDDGEDEGKVSPEPEGDETRVGDSSTPPLSPSVIMELDLIAEELRTPPRRTYRRTVGPRADRTLPEAPVDEKDSDHDPLAGLD